MKKLLVLFVVLLTTGCMGTPKFSVVERDARFNSDGSRLITASGNRISSRSGIGGVHIDRKGLYFDPAAVIDTSGQVRTVLLNVYNRTGASSDFGAPNSLGAIRQVVFLVDDVPVTLTAAAGETVHDDVAVYNSVSQQATLDFVEYAQFVVNLNTLARIAAAEQLAVKISGSRRAFVYENSDIAGAFRANFATFLAALP